ncbi:arylsulfatase [Mangrovibacterium diazotrophicum]|uniref:Arylsulfatase A-like enzyme n=1 Tax=Mangrovibacterium diazotrophicum TaxID=1261403 RepID=A0A419W556_9BACT|nr:arylsulfatase [Mangrovibacterium diazotrophicum]RKD90598.1 arylsulfatase A-like enzyme [Mangrovibacterium diazotrophicum]
MKRNYLSGLVALLAFTACQTATKPTVEEKKPNIIYILADDLGYGDLSCYGQQKFETPNIDKLATEGMRFTNHYAGCAVCAPSRSSLLTGQTTGFTPIRGNVGTKPEGQLPLPADAFTVAELLQQNGYVTGAFGKWGLGFIDTDGDPNKQGFDEFYGFNCQTLAHNYFPGHLWDNQSMIELDGNADDQFEEYAPELIHEEAMKFLERNKDTTFFMFYPSVIPHAELKLPEKYLAKFRGKYDPEKQFEGADYGSPRFRTGGYGSQQECHAAFAAMVSVLDDEVGEIMAKLKELGIDDNTLVIFSSDNGPHIEGGADPDYFDSNGPLKGYKRDLYEGGIREPMIARWPDKIAAGSSTDLISAFWDVMPTFAELVGAGKPTNIQGISFLPTLLNEPGQKKHDYLYWEFHENGGRQAIRQGDWKYVSYNVSDPEKQTLELYDLSKDPGEEHNLAAEHPEVVEEMQQILWAARTESAEFPFGMEGHSTTE